ncbi:unnamed protein product [Lymnaea stagnalis]|uniref:Uncharacterized protein n=1 Tax=Lymnaea stagnalis TaxID=6523 RepID=A0AAV2IIU3_LYMST
MTGRIILEEGELMPAIISYEYKCPGSELCYTYNGPGEIWDRLLYIAAGKCDDETQFYGCKLISGRTYRHFVFENMYYYFRLCTVRARMMDQQVNEKLTSINAHVSNELKFSDYKNHSSYSLEEEEEFLRIIGDDPECDPTRTSKNGVDKINLPDALLIILGSIMAFNVIVIF